MIHLMPPPEMGSRLVGLGLPPTMAQTTVETIGFAAILNNILSFVPKLLGALVVLIGGLILAFAVAWVIKSLLNKTSIDERLASAISGSSSNNINLAKWISNSVFWIIALLALVGFLNALDLTVVSEPLGNLIDTVLQYIPRLISAGVLLLVAWVIATVVKTIVNRVFEGFNLDDKLAENTGVDPRENSIRIHETLGTALYWFVFLLFLPPVLNALELNGLLSPVQNLLDQFLSAIPKIITALLIFGAGWLLAKIVRSIVTNLLAASGIDGLGHRVGLARTPASSGGLSLSGLAGTIVYVLILIPVAIAALEQLSIDAISDPAVNMLGQVLDFIPLLIAAGVVLTVFYFIGQFVSELVTGLLESVGFNNVLDMLGLPEVGGSRTPVPPTTPVADLGTPGATMIQPPTDTSTPKTPSEIAGLITLVAIVLFGAVTATEILQLEQLTLIVRAVMEIAAQVLVGVVIFAIGLYVANLAFRLIKSSGISGMVAQAARVVILVFVGALALAQMGVAPNIVNLAFGLLLGAVAVAIAISFGLGGRDVAGEQLKEWLGELKK